MFLLNEEISKDDLKKYIKELYDYCRDELKKIDRDVRIFLNEDKKNADDIFGKTAYYSPEKEEIHLFITDRHPKDVLRSLAHEMVHHEQNCRGDTDKLNMSITSQDPSYALHDDGLREMEREAFEIGSMIFRDWCDKNKMLRKKEKIMEGKIKVKMKKQTISEEIPVEPFIKKYGEEKGKEIHAKTVAARTGKAPEVKKEMSMPSMPSSMPKIKEDNTYDGSSSKGAEMVKDMPRESKKMKCESCGGMYQEGKKHKCEESKHKMHESKDLKTKQAPTNPHPELFQEKERLFKERFNNHEEIIFQELLKRAIK